jgi:hypothetical protein
MMRPTVGVLKPRPVTALLVAVGAAELGHALVYLLRYGPSSAGIESNGAHAYFPALTGTLSALLGGGLIAALLLTAVARLVGATPPGHVRRRTTRIFDVLPALFLAQLVIFLCQEVGEALAFHERLPSLVALLLWATAGQLPAALLGALVLGWLWAGLAAAWTVVAEGPRRALSLPAPVEQPAAPARPEGCPALASVCPAALRKRGPPPAPFPRLVF